MNQRAVSAPNEPMMSSGSTVLRFDFDIFSMAPISTGAPVAISDAWRASPTCSIFTSAGVDPGAVGGAVGLVDHHALGEQAGERLVDTDVTGRLHGAGEEAAVEQVQDRMLDAADILVDRQPLVDCPALGRRRRDPGIGEAGEIPGRIDEGVHGVGFAPRRAAALRTGHMLPGRMAVERIAGPVERRRRPAASPASPFPAPGRRRIRCNG